MSTVDGAEELLGESLAGRGPASDRLSSSVADAASGGGVLLVFGDPGIGKTTLLGSATTAASAAGSRVLRAEGVEFEVDLRFASLNQLLLPVPDDMDALTPAHRAALSTALGLHDVVPPLNESRPTDAPDATVPLPSPAATAPAQRARRPETTTHRQLQRKEGAAVSHDHVRELPTAPSTTHDGTDTFYKHWGLGTGRSYSAMGSRSIRTPSLQR